jgi:hypothetical protein
MTGKTLRSEPVYAAVSAVVLYAQTEGIEVA